MGDITKAKETLKEVEELGNIYLRILAQIELAEACRQLANYIEAENHLKEALVTSSAYFGPNSFLELTILQRLLPIYSSLSNSFLYESTKSQYYSLRISSLAPSLSI
jgi:hypothetical protein